MADVNITVTEETKTIQVLNVAAASSVTFDYSHGSNLVATNVRDALEELDNRMAVGTTPSTSGAYAQDGDLFYDTDDDEVLVRREGAWKEIVIEATTGNIDGGTFT